MKQVDLSYYYNTLTDNTVLLIQHILYTIMHVIIYYLFIQKFRVLATETLNPKVLESDIQSAVPTEKLDGTCCYVSAYKGNQRPAIKLVKGMYYVSVWWCTFF